MNKSNQGSCDSTAIVDFLSERLPQQHEEELMEHLDSCERCRVRLRNEAGESGIWNEFEAALRDQPDDSVRLSSAGEWHRDISSSAATQIEQVIDMLGPTDDPGMLGRIGGYEVSGVIGSGGMGVVLKAHDKALDRLVAIKVLAPHLASSGAARKRFARESKAAAAVLHPNVMAIHNVSNDESFPYLVMPYLRGVSLQNRIESEGPLPVCEILRIGSQIAGGLAAAHAQGLVHRDIKPANTLLEEGVERVAITDFGLARAVDDATLTRTGIIAGTPQYMSPEQARGDAVDQRSDLFSLGSVLYAMCTGRPPFRAETSYGVLRRITDDEPTPIRNINPAIPEWLCGIIAKLMSKAPEKRLESAGKVAELLEAFLAHEQQPEVVPLPERVREFADSRSTSRRRLIHKWLAGAAAALAVVLAGFVILLELNKGTLRIENETDDVAVRITQGTKTVKELTVSRAGKDVRIAAGEYVVDIQGEADGITVKDGAVSLRRGEQEIVRIVKQSHTQVSEPSDSPKKSKGTKVESGKILTAAEVMKNANSIHQDFKDITVRFKVHSATRFDVIDENDNQLQQWKLSAKAFGAEVVPEPFSVRLSSAVEAALRKQGVVDVPMAFIGKEIQVTGQLTALSLNLPASPQRILSYYIPVYALDQIRFVDAEKENPKTANNSHETTDPLEADDKIAARKTLINNIQGEWILVRMNEGLEDVLKGNEYPLSVEGTLLNFRFYAPKNPNESSTLPILLHWKPGSPPEWVEATLDPNGTPEQLPGILRYDGKTLRLCVNQDAGNTKRPRVMAAGSKVLYFECRRLGATTFHRVLRDDRYGKDWMIDLDRGTLHTPPKSLSGEKQMTEWMRTQGIDATGIKANQGLLAPFELLTTPLSGKSFSDYRLEDVTTTLNLAAGFVEEGVPPLSFCEPGEYAFKTREGGVGVLRVERVTDDGKGLKLRYKILAAAPQPIPKQANLIREFPTKADVKTIACSPDGQRIAVANGDPTLIMQRDGSSRVKNNWQPAVQVLDAETGKRLVSLELANDEERAILAATKHVSHFEVTALEFSPDGKFLAVGTSIGQVKLFHAKTGLLYRSLDDKPTKTADKVTPENWKPLKRAIGSVADLAFSPEGRQLAVCGRSFSDFSDVFDGSRRLGRLAKGPGRLKVWDIETATLEHDLPGHSEAVAVAYAPNGKLLASVGRPGLNIWDPETGKKLWMRDMRANAGTRAVAFSPDSRLVAITTLEFDKDKAKDAATGAVDVLHSATGIVEWRRSFPGWAKPVAFAPDGKSILALCNGDSIRFLNSETGEVVNEIKPPDSPDTGYQWMDVSISNQAHSLVIGGRDKSRSGRVEIWSLPEHNPTANVPNVKKRND